MHALSPPLDIHPREVPALPRAISRESLSPEGYITSVQAARFETLWREGLDPAHLAVELSREYGRVISKLGAFFVRPKADPDGSVRFTVRGITLLALSPPEALPGALEGSGIARRHVRDGRLVPRVDRGRGVFDVIVRRDGPDLLVEIRVADYRSAVRGTRASSPLRSALYLQSQSRFHRWVTIAFLKKFCRPVIDRMAG